MMLILGLGLAEKMKSTGRLTKKGSKILRVVGSLVGSEGKGVEVSLGGAQIRIGIRGGSGSVRQDPKVTRLHDYHSILYIFVFFILFNLFVKIKKIEKMAET